MKTYEVLYVIGAAICGFGLGIAEWDERILIICLSLSWIPLYFILQYVIVPIVDYFELNKNKGLKK